MPVAPSPSLAVTLSFLLPGLGQASLGAVRRGVLIALPAVAIVPVAIASTQAGGAAIDAVIGSELLVAILVVNLLLCAYHGLAIADAYRLGVRSRPGPAARRLSTIVLAVALLATLALHGAVEAIAYQAYDTLGAVFVPSGPSDAWSVPEASFEPEPSPTVVRTASPPATTPSPSAAAIGVMPSASPSARPSTAPSPAASAVPKWAKDGRLNLLLIGSDAGPDRWSLRTDTVIVLSVQVKTGRMALFGIPRNIVGVPLPPESAGAFTDGRFPGMLNALYVYAMGHPKAFPGGDARGFRAVSGAVQELVGVPLDGVIVVNLRGFVRLVNAIGGLWIDVPERVVDRNYPLEDGSGHIAIDIKAGCQRLNGRMALAYARSRHQDSDYGRMRRQQAVLVALARQTDPIALVPKVPELLGIAKDNLWTTVKRSDIRGLAEFAAGVRTARVKTVLFVPSAYPSHLDTAEIKQIRRVVRSAFDNWTTGTTLAPAPSSTCP